MKIIIRAGTKKRQIDGPYALCGNRIDIEVLRDRLNDALNDNFSFGWIEITERAPYLENTSPEPWNL